MAFPSKLLNVPRSNFGSQRFERVGARGQRGPHWADPLKAWDDVLLKQGHPKEALVRYDEALKYAPNWAALKEARAAITKQKT